MPAPCLLFCFYFTYLYLEVPFSSLSLIILRYLCVSYRMLNPSLIFGYIYVVYIYLSQLFFDSVYLSLGRFCFLFSLVFMFLELVLT